MYRRILVAYDGSEGARAALKQGIALAKALNAELSCVLVEEHLPHYAASISEVKAAKEEIDEHFRTLAKQARDLAALGGIDMETIVRQGHEVDRYGCQKMASSSSWSSAITGIALSSVASWVAPRRAS